MNSIVFLKDKNYVFIVLCLATILTLFFLTLQNSFFWDTTQLGSKHANFFLKNHFSSLILPNQIDSGHIPAFGFYIGLMWKVFGRTLFVSHMAMLPFVIGIVWQLYRLMKEYVDWSALGVVVFIILLDPSLLSQMVLVSPDVALVFFFLWGWNSVVNNRKWAIGLSVLFLFLTSMRGMMVAFCLLFIDLLYNINFAQNWKRVLGLLLNRSVLYIPSVLVFIGFNLYHYAAKGWIIYYEGSSWADCFEPVGFKGAVFNVGILGWRILDFGRVGIWLVFLILCLKYGKSIWADKKTRYLIFIYALFLVLLPANMLWAKNLLAHRYLIPLFLIFSILTSRILFSSYVETQWRRGLVLLWLTLIISGNFWIYPDRVSQGWDSTLAHLPYYKLRKEAIDYIDSASLDLSEVHSFFPNNSVIDDIDLNGDDRMFAPYTKGANYVLYSNVFNVEDAIYDLLMEEYDLLEEFSDGGVRLELYRRSVPYGNLKLLD